MKLFNQIRSLRMQRGELSQQQLAEMVGVSRQTIISIESGCKNPSVELALKLFARVFDLVEQHFENFHLVPLLSQHLL